jgi:hypothetical protein
MGDQYRRKRFGEKDAPWKNAGSLARFDERLIFERLL